MIGVSCPAMPFKSTGDEVTKLLLCERMTWHVAGCQMQGPDVMTPEEQCAHVVEVDKLWLKLQNECMARPMDPNDVPQRYEALMACLYPPIGDRFRIPFCNERMTCMKAAGFEW